MLKIPTELGKNVFNFQVQESNAHNPMIRWNSQHLVLDNQITERNLLSTYLNSAFSQRMGCHPKELWAACTEQTDCYCYFWSPQVVWEMQRSPVVWWPVPRSISRDMNSKLSYYLHFFHPTETIEGLLQPKFRYGHYLDEKHCLKELEGDKKLRNSTCFQVHDDPKPTSSTT